MATLNILILLKATYESSIGERTVGKQWLRKVQQCWVSSVIISLGFRICAVDAFILVEYCPYQDSNPGPSSPYLVTIPTTLPTVEAEFVAKFGVCLKDRGKEKDQKYRYHYIKRGWVRSNSLPPPIRNASTFKLGTYRITYITATANLLPQITWRSLGITFLSPFSCLTVKQDTKSDKNVKARRAALDNEQHTWHQGH
jgi:hypothetical protein